MKRFSQQFLKASAAPLALACAAVIGVAAPTAAYAQDVTAAPLSGTVVDASGNAVADATVVIEGEGRGFSRTTTTTGNGTFSVPQLPIGNYTVTISGSGIATTRNEGVNVSIGGSAYTFNVTAPDAGGSEIVVTGTRIRQIDFSGTATGAVIDVQDVVNRVPVARSIEAIQLLTPQATSGDATFGSVSLAGSSVAENIYYINGMNVTNFRTFVGGSTVPFEFYDQVQVKTGGYQAEFGRNTGGAVIAVSRSGSNDFKGGFNVFYTPNGLREKARDTYQSENSTDDRVNLEGNIWASGPIIKDRLFFFGFFNPRYSFQGDTSRTENRTDNVPNGTFTTTNRNTFKSQTPFYGGKLDLNLFDGHRVEATYFNDSNDELQTVINTQNPDAVPNTLTNYSGGENYIFKYTGAFTDWFTLSGLYGKSKYERTSAGNQDALPYTVDRRSGSATLIQGSPNALVGTDFDSRENYRVDADIKVSLLGEHQIRIGYDHEKLVANSLQAYSGGIAYIFERAGDEGARDGLIAPNTDYARVQTYGVGGEFNSTNDAFYIQDSWDITDRINLSLGVRNDKFVNRDKNNEVFTELTNQWAPRLGVNFDVFGDKRARLSAFYGRYYLPVAANTNTRLAGGELFLRDFYTLPVDGSGNYTGSLTSPTLGTLVEQLVFSDGSLSPATTLVAKNIKPQYLDEFIVGGEYRFANRHRLGLNLIYRKLGAVLEDVDFDGDGGSFESIADAYCATQTLSYCNPEYTPLFGSGGYVLMNPGSDLVVDSVGPDGSLNELVIPASFIGIPKARRTYYAAELTYDIPFNGTWGLNASYVWSRSRGNYEGGVKSDNGQDDTGITSDFDEPGFTDGADGFLPNHREHTFKVYGNWAPIENLNIGVSALLQSPRKFGCLGSYPVGDGRGSDANAVSWYCNAQIVRGTVDGTLDQPVGRGNVFQSDWNKRVDLSLSYTIPAFAEGGLKFGVDVFNVFNFRSKLDFNERGDIDDVDVPDLNYGKVQSYQTPRSVRFSISGKF